MLRFSVFSFLEKFGAVDGLHDHALDLLGDPVGLLDVRADGHVDVDVDILRLVLWEELHLGWEHAQQHEGCKQQSDHAVEEQPRLGAAERETQQALIAVLQGGKELVLKPSGSRCQEVPVEQANDAAEHEEVAQGVPSGAQQEQPHNE